MTEHKPGPKRIVGRRAFLTCASCFQEWPCIGSQETEEPPVPGIGWMAGFDHSDALVDVVAHRINGQWHYWHRTERHDND